MKAVRVHRFGGPEVLTCEEVPRPDAGEGQVIVQIKAIFQQPAKDSYASN